MLNSTDPFSTSLASTDYHFESVPVSHLPLVKRFYKQANYFNQVGRKDEVYCLREKGSNNAIVAAVRLVKTADYLILRSMVVLPEFQRQGLGKYFLSQLDNALNRRACWCFPFEWLEGFYQRIGFVTIEPEKAPKLIHTKYQQYREQGRKILIMRYPKET
jgi:N-acetylglutamate synthase-like GNAT family acetyltransferase